MGDRATWRPGAHLRRLRLSLGRRFLGLGKPKPRGSWDRQFAAGAWDYLDAPSQDLRFRVLATLIDRHSPPGSRVLDVGCGTATLARHLPTEAASGYVGVDVSAEAIERGRSRAPAGASLFVACGDGPICPEAARVGPYGALVFSEVLYYLASPWGTIARYARALRPDGLIFISLWDPGRHRVLRMRLARRLEVVASVTVAAAAGKPWLILVARPRPG